jgi:Tol biopolymer transport system component
VYVKKDLDADIYNIVMGDLNSGEETYLTDNESEDVDYVYPQVSPDGQKIVYQLSTKVTVDSKTWWKNEIYSMSIDGSEVEKLSQIELPAGSSEEWAGYMREMSPSWSPDGQSLWLTSNREDLLAGTFDPDKPVSRLYSLNLDTRQYKLNPAVKGNILRPMLSPNGKVITLTALTEGATKILLINANGSSKTNSFDWKGASLYTPVWSPDGKKITFSSDREGSLDLYSIDVVPGSNQIKADSAAPLTAVNSSADDYRPCWSPDGSWLLFVSDRENKTKHIYMYNRITGETERLSDYEGEEDMPVWVP